MLTFPNRSAACAWTPGMKVCVCVGGEKYSEMMNFTKVVFIFSVLWKSNYGGWAVLKLDYVTAQDCPHTAVSGKDRVGFAEIYQHCLQ